MTPARKRALQWFYEQGAVKPPLSRTQPDWLTERMFRRMMRQGEVSLDIEGWSLTDRGRRILHGDAK